jgi:hypothetical protein
MAAKRSVEIIAKRQVSGRAPNRNNHWPARRLTAARAVRTQPEAVRPSSAICRGQSPPQSHLAQRKAHAPPISQPACQCGMMPPPASPASYRRLRAQRHAPHGRRFPGGDARSPTRICSTMFLFCVRSSGERTFPAHSSADASRYIAPAFMGPESAADTKGGKTKLGNLLCHSIRQTIYRMCNVVPSARMIARYMPSRVEPCRRSRTAPWRCGGSVCDHLCCFMVPTIRSIRSGWRVPSGRLSVVLGTHSKVTASISRRSKNLFSLATRMSDASAHSTRSRCDDE